MEKIRHVKVKRIKDEVVEEPKIRHVKVKRIKNELICPEDIIHVRVIRFKKEYEKFLELTGVAPDDFIENTVNKIAELYFKYNDTGDGCYTLFPNGNITPSNPNEYITNPYWDGTHFEADILFSSNKNASFWQQFAIVFAAAGSKTTNLKFDNFELFPLSRTVVSLSVDPSTKTSFDCDEAYSSESVVVTAQRKDGTSFVLDKDLYTVDSSSYKSNTPGQYQVAISAVDSITNATLETSYNVTVNDKVDSIQIKTNPTKTTYNYGEELDLTGISASKVYRSGTEEPLEVTLDMVSGYDKNTLGTQTVTVIYNGLTATFEVNVVDYVSSIEVASNPTKTTYKYGEELDIAGLAVNQVYASGAKSQIEVSSEMVSGYNKNTLGTQTVTVTYNGLTATFEVSVVDYITGISLKTAPTKVEYEINEQLDVTGGVITVNKASGATEDVNITKEMVTGFDSGCTTDHKCGHHGFVLRSRYAWLYYGRYPIRRHALDGSTSVGTRLCPPRDGFDGFPQGAECTIGRAEP